MAYYAELDGNNVVKRVIVADLSFLGVLGGTWMETKMDGSLRKNYAGVGHKYDTNLDAFVPPKPFPSWSLNQITAIWESPVPMPADHAQRIYIWDENTLNWITK